MQSINEPKLLPVSGIPGKFRCDREAIYAAASERRIKLWTYADPWRDAIEALRLDRRVYYAEVLPEDALRYRTESVRPLLRVQVGGQLVTAGGPVAVNDGELFVYAEEAEKVFGRLHQPEPAPSPPDPSQRTDEPLGDRKEENLLRTIGALFLYITENKSGYKHGEQLSKHNVATKVFNFINGKDLPVTGLSIRSLEDRLTDGLAALQGRPKQ